MQPKLLIFDLFGTLVFPVEKIKKEDFFAFYRSLGIKLKTKEDIDYFTEVFIKAMKSSLSWEGLSQKIVQETLGVGDKEIVEKLTNFFKENVIYQLFDDVKGIVDLPYKKAILTDASRFLFSKLNLEEHFKIFTPKETKFSKPDEKAFLAVLDFFGVRPKETVMIGDRLEKDLIPAKNLGMETILIDRENKVEDSPVKKINSLRELKEILI